MKPDCGQNTATKVLVVGQTPPPYFGQALAIEWLLASEIADVQLLHVRMSFSSNMDEMGRFRVAKVLHMLSVVARIIYHRFVDGVRILYYPPAGNNRVPMYRDIFMLCCTRWLFDKTIFHFHAGGVSELYDQLPSWQRWFFRRAYFGADAAVRASDLNPEDGKKLAAKREYLVPCGINDPFPGLMAAPATVAASESDRLRMLFVGILSEAKGVGVLIEACASLAVRGVPFEVELMGQWGSPDFSDSVHRRIEELNLGKQIKFLGVLTGQPKFDAFRRANVFCFPTHLHCETFGLVLLEAMACGLPVVASRWRAIPSIVDEGQTGFLIDPYDSLGLADRLAELAHDASLRQRMGRAGRAKFEREYTLDRHVSGMRQVFLETADEIVNETSEEASDLSRAAPIADRSRRVPVPMSAITPQPSTK